MTLQSSSRRRQSGQTTLAFLALGLALAVGLIVSAALVSRSLERIKLAGDKITVKGYAEEQVVSDAGTWRGTVTVRAADLQAGYRLLEADTARVLELLESVAGASAAAVVVSPVAARPQYEISADRRADRPHRRLRARSQLRAQLERRRADRPRRRGRPLR